MSQKLSNFGNFFCIFLFLLFFEGSVAFVEGPGHNGTMARPSLRPISGLSMQANLERLAISLLYKIDNLQFDVT